jgi:diguanylate cyclase (GGDEF)-like protein
MKVQPKNNSLDQIRRLNQRAWELSRKDGPRSYRLAKRVEGLIFRNPDAHPRDEFECLRTQTYCLDMLSKPDKALPIGLKANGLAEQIGDKYLIGTIQSILGRIYWHIDDFPTSMDYYLNALKLVQAENHPDLELSLINGLGMVAYGLEDYPKSLEYFRTCLEKASKEDLTSQADANNNIAYVLHLLGRDQEALPFAEAAIGLFQQLDSYVGRLHTLHTLGAILQALHEYDRAIKVLQEGLDLARANDSQLLEITYIIEISHIHQTGGQSDQAEEELLHALETAQKINSITNRSLAHERLVEIYKEKGNYQSALDHFEAYFETYKEIFNDKSDRRIKNLEILHQVELTRKQADVYREMAGTDSLTGLFNRRHFLEIAEDILQQVRNTRGRLAVMMLDIDHFKNVNDRHGHKIGDKVLAGVAAGIKKSLRQGDIAARYGGEEFTVLIAGAMPEQSVKIAERIRSGASQQAVRIDQTIVRVTLSLGLAYMDPDQDLSLDELINRADQAMYAAKQQGRDRVVVWTENNQTPDQKPSRKPRSARVMH